MSKDKWKEKKEQVAQLTDSMDKAINKYFETPEQTKEYLAFMMQFHNYSPRNSALIWNQFQGARAVGSYKLWKEKGFNVNKGEKGIQVLVPNKSVPKFQTEDGKWKNIKYATEKEKKQIDKGELNKQKSRLYFSVGHVFDVSQTNAKVSDLPDIFPNRWMEGEVDNYQTVMESLHKLGDDIGVTIGEPFEELGSAKGAFYYGLRHNKNHIGLNPRNSELQNVKTLIHELAHAKLHHRNHENHYLSDSEKEFQAEMTAYSVASYFGIDTSDYSLSYLAHWTQGKELKDKTKLLNEVRETAVAFIGTIESVLVKEREKVADVKQNDEQQMEFEDAMQGIVFEEEHRKDIDGKFNKKSEEKKMYSYEMTLRGISPGSQPNGFIEFDDNKGNHGVVVYDRALTEKEMDDYDLKPWTKNKEKQRNERKKETAEMEM